MPPFVLIIVSLLIWLFPLWAFRAKNAKLGGFDQRGWPRGRNLVLSFFDVARAWVGADLLVRSSAFLSQSPFEPEWNAPLWLGLALGSALLVNAFVWRSEDYLMAPIMFVIGALPALVHWQVLLIGLPLGIGAALAIRAWSAGLIGAGVGVAGVGMVVLEQDWRRSLLLGVALTVPVCVSMLVGRHLGAPRK